MVSVEFAQSEKYSLSTDIFFFFKNCTCPQVKRAQQSEQGVQFLLYVQSIKKKKKMSVDVFGKKSLFYVNTLLLSLHYHPIIHYTSYIEPMTLKMLNVCEIRDQAVFC